MSIRIGETTRGERAVDWGYAFLIGAVHLGQTAMESVRGARQRTGEWFGRYGLRLVVALAQSERAVYEPRVRDSLHRQRDPTQLAVHQPVGAEAVVLAGPVAPQVDLLPPVVESPR